MGALTGGEVTFVVPERCITQSPGCMGASAARAETELAPTSNKMAIPKRRIRLPLIISADSKNFLDGQKCNTNMSGYDIKNASA
jgi:hypothetical protein